MSRSEVVDEVERRERDATLARESFAQALGTLKEGASPRRLAARAVADAEYSFGTDLASSILEFTRRNPAALIVIGIGFGLGLALYRSIGSNHRERPGSTNGESRLTASYRPAPATPLTNAAAAAIPPTSTEGRRS